jgi:aspartate/methionine/tyrosine aminotransferase
MRSSCRWRISLRKGTTLASSPSTHLQSLVGWCFYGRNDVCISHDVETKYLNLCGFRVSIVVAEMRLQIAHVSIASYHRMSAKTLRTLA